MQELERVIREALERDALELLPLPSVAQEVLSATSDASSGAAALAKLVHKDPALAAAILRRANSAGLGGVTTIVSVQRAIARLGSRRVAETAIALCLRDGPFSNAAYPALMAATWKRALASGLFAKELARVRRTNVEFAFLAGLLWRVGDALVLGALCSLCDARSRPDEAGAAALTESLGEALTAAAVRGWELPEALKEALDPRQEAGDESDGLRQARFARTLAVHAAAGKPSGDLHGHPDAVVLNLYPEDLDAILERGPAIRAECEALR